jgi:hypothetical protein
MKITSAAFGPGARVPPRHGCEGADQSPPLTWSEVPKQAKSLALVCSDPDAPAGTWYHWAAFDMPTATTGLPESYQKAARVGKVRQAINDFGKPGYGGPCPPKGHGTHHYHFRLYALDVEKLDLKDGAKCKDVEAAAERHAIAKAELVGTYSR